MNIIIIKTDTSPPHTLPVRVDEVSQHLPRQWPKMLSRRHRLLHCCIQNVHGISGRRISPPIRRRLIRQIQTEEDDNGTDSQSDIQAGRGEVVEPHPPAAVLVHDVLVEHVPDNAPREIVQRRGRRDRARAPKNNRCGQVADVGLGEHAGGDVDDDRKEGADEPEPQEAAVQVARREDTLGPDETPDDGGVEEDTAVGAAVVIRLSPGADAADAAESPFEDGDLNEAGPDGRDDLAAEHDSRRDFHVVAEFEILNEG